MNTRKVKMFVKKYDEFVSEEMELNPSQVYNKLYEKWGYDEKRANYEFRKFMKITNDEIHKIPKINVKFTFI